MIILINGKQLQNYMTRGIHDRIVCRIVVRIHFTPDLDSKGVPMVFTPNQFMFDVYGDRKFDNWDMKDRINKWVFDNRYALAPIFVNITERLYNTHKHIINFIEKDLPKIFFSTSRSIVNALSRKYNIEFEKKYKFYKLIRC